MNTTPNMPGKSGRSIRVARLRQERKDAIMRAVRSVGACRPDWLWRELCGRPTPAFVWRSAFDALVSEGRLLLSGASIARVIRVPGDDSSPAESGLRKQTGAPVRRHQHVATLR